MLFNSLSFAIFFPIVLCIYWSLRKKLKYQNLLLAIASCYFYACWDWRFLFLLMFSIGLDYISGIKIENSKTNREAKFWLTLSIVINLGFLGFFKYYNFFVGSFADLLNGFGIKVNVWLLNIILPVGISFYTFHGLSYVIDIYKKRIKAERNFIDYSLFVSFFPLLVAGPIERATHLLPQIKKERQFSYENAVSGLRQIIWGLFKKIVIADQCAIYVNDIFELHYGLNGSTLLIGAILFSFQIYGDFSGYSDIALGTARMMGFDLLKNFNYPYFSRDIAEFWRRWHISLSSWFRDYLYIPLGGSKGGNWMRVRNTFIIFLVSGFWHGANWTFIVWGGLNALFIMPSIIVKTNRKNLDVAGQNSVFPSLKEFCQIIITFGLATFAWIFFRSDSVLEALKYIRRMFSRSLFYYPQKDVLWLFSIIVVFIGIEWIGRRNNFAIENIHSINNRFVRWGLYYFIAAMIIYFSGEQHTFIYFQF
ncbi:D-alanyl-lipoteichoic acid acyltransferase DltB, MBOAT superfamily [Chryseobacterium oranimense]|uniref:D-alanyl-lipoteichoic acid acyltransferase DltB, MBOAT superfamily n=1 Tax=Chryseobacterium oranimense TaxID=421058 RepID=A0A1M5X824_9FLAO|nr:MBOAT family O-acyltransferase [Chryseobacterium oranimense]SHH95792.1 D-alanyl-lipoteichoic acid acyltransferase DltB, MBOAT superfamily [Chryseobacterium oranimense]